MQDETDSRSGPVGEERAQRVPPIVAIGASAGGLEALRALLEATPADTGACFVFVQHLDPTHKSMLPELLGRVTRMEVVQARESMAGAANKVIIIPPDATLTISQGILHIETPAPPRQHRTPIDTFLTSLAEDQGDRAIGIILSGTGSDGTEGLRRLKEAGGLTIVQDPASAKYDSMPRSAAGTTQIDHVLAPEDMPGALIEHLERLDRLDANGCLEGLREQMRSDLTTICSVLKARTGHEFQYYKEATLIRRINRRMQIMKLDDPRSYVERLREDNNEAHNLFRELIISVTSFFREPAAFKALREKVLRPMVASIENGGHLRAWVPACATGEEAFTLAMILHDLLDESGKQVKAQIFASDIDEQALETARRGCYPDSIVAKIPDRYRKRYLRPEGSQHRVVDELREMCLFSLQSVIKDPPFGRLDLISCRNLLIYMKPALQNRLVPIFHYALREGGVLFLGSSENVTKHARLFKTVDSKWRIFRRRETSPRQPVQFPLSQVDTLREPSREPKGRTAATDSRPSSAALQAERLILERLGPAFALINETREVLHTGGDTEPYFSVPRGPATQDVLALTRPELRMDVRGILHQQRQQRGTVVREDVTLKEGTERRRLRIECMALTGEGAKQLLVFHDCGLSRTPVGARDGDDQASVEALETELRNTKLYLQTTTEELESSNEELKSANEELMSMNEELQSSNEELETSKEELQSVNEELETVNAELGAKVEELSRSNADLQNLFESTQIATIFMDRDLRVRRFTPVAKEVFHLIGSDRGRSITDITAKITDTRFESDARAVLATLSPVQREVHQRDSGAVFMMRLLPYRSAENVIDGVVATFVDVTELKTAEDDVRRLNTELEERLAELETLVSVAPIGIAFADDPEAATISLNSYGARLLQTPNEVPPAGDDKPYRFVVDGRTVPAEELPLQKAWTTARPVHDFRATYVHDNGTTFEVLISAAPVFDGAGQVRRTIGVFDDISMLTQAQAKAERRAAQQDFIATLSGRSLRGMSLDTLIAGVPREVARMLGADCAKVLQYRPDTDDFLLTAQYGFNYGVDELVVVPSGMESQAGYTLNSDEPVIVENLTRERRFSGPAILHEHEVLSGISVVIAGHDGRWGVLGIHSRKERSFSADEVTFVQSVANVISSTVLQERATRLQQVLVAELRHRVKNTLATVQAISSLSLRPDKPMEESLDAFQMRIQALAQTHDLLFRANWESIEFGELVAGQLRPFTSERDRISVSGTGGTTVGAATAMSVGMVIHELLTNASKYGSLSTEAGQVEISWAEAGEGDDRHVEFRWIETGGPRVSPPAREGVGTTLIRDAFTGTTNGELKMDFAPGGLNCLLRIPIG